jgi:chromosome segregation ATPase
MDSEQLQKRVEWLDEERRRDKATIATLEDRVLSLEGGIARADKLAAELTSELTRLKTALARLDHFDASVSQLRLESTRRMDEMERARAEHDAESEDVRRAQMESVNKALNDLRKETEQFAEVFAQIRARTDEDARLSRKLDEMQNQLLTARREDEDETRTIRLLEEGRRRDDKRLSDLQAEALTLRKRADEQRGKLDIASDSVRRIENRLNELATVEGERRENYNAFVEKQTLAQVDRDRRWMEWQSRFETIEKQAMDLESQLQQMHTTHLDIRRLQGEVEETVERVDRRINEITEMQRLGEDRFRQEWTTFKADDQKRWTNYTLTQEEQTREAARLQTRAADRMTELEESIQTLEDNVEQIMQQTERRLQRLLAVARDWAAEYEQAFGAASR